jgi:hypothetical protein
MIQAYLEAAQALGQALIKGDVEAFKTTMASSAKAMGPAYLEEMLRKSRQLQQHLT